MLPNHTQDTGLLLSEVPCHLRPVTKNEGDAYCYWPSNIIINTAKMSNQIAPKREGS